MAVTEKHNGRPARSTSLVPGMTPKRLPWLDGMASQAVSVVPHNDNPSPTTRSFGRKPSILTVPNRTAAAYTTADSIVRVPEYAPALRKKLTSPRTERRLLAVGSPLESSPSPVTRHRMAQSRRQFTAQQPTFHPSSISHESQKNLSFAGSFHPGSGTGAFNEYRARADSLASVPDHLEPSSASEPSDLPLERNMATAINSPVVISRVQMSPFRPRPGRNAFERTGDRRMSNAIEDLEVMVQEAVETADDTMDHDQVEEIYDIIEDARQTIQDAFSNSTKHLLATSSPLPVSGSSHEWEEHGSYPKALSHPRLGRTPTVPLPQTQRNIVEDPSELVSPQVQVDMQRGPTSMDWACYPHRGSDRTNSSSSSSGSNRTGHSRLGSRNDLLLPPDPTQTTLREHVGFVLRPVARDHSRGRPHRRITRDEAVRSRKPHRHTRLQSLISSDRKARSKTVSRRKRHNVSETSVLEESFNEEHIPPRQYDNNQAHQHTVNLRRHHRRQPIARNWSTGKKRLTAIIACLNTSLLGIIIGVYVSGPIRCKSCDL